MNSQRPDRVDLEAPPQRTPLWCASSGLSSASCQRARAGLPVEDDGADLVVAVAEDVARDLDDVADRALGRVAAGVDGGLRVLDVDPRRWRHTLRRRHRGGVSARAKVANVALAGSLSCAPCRSRARQASSCIPPRCPPAGSGAEAYAWVDWLADAGQTWWQMLPLGPPDRYGSPYKSRSAFAAWPGLLAEPPRRSPRPRSSTSASARRAGSRTGRAFAGRGAVADQVRFDREWARAARLRGRARRAADRRRPDLRRAGLGRPSRASRSCSATTPSRARRRTPSPTRASSGATRSTTGPRCSGAATAGGSRGSRARSPSSTSRGSTTSAASSPTGRCRRARARARRALAARPGPRGVRGRARGAGRAAADRRGPRRDHAGRSSGCATRSGCRGWSCSSSASTPATRTASTTSPNHAEDRIAYTGTHDNDTLRGWYESLPGDARALVDAARPRRREERRLVGPDRADVRLAARASRWCRRRTCSGSARRRA